MANYGYDGTLDEVEFAKAIMLGGGSPYAVIGAGDFQATIGGAGDRALTIAAGEAVGKGVRSTLAQVLKNLGAVSSGSRWDLVALRRDWNANTAAIVVIPGGPNPVIPLRQVANAEPWIQDDQPLWLARVQAGQSVVQELIDLRVWVSAGGATAADKLALTYLDALGTQIMIGGVLYVRAIASNGTAEWKQLGGTLPRAMLLKVGNQDLPSAQSVQLVGTSIAYASGGIEKEGDALRIPVSGWYRVTYKFDLIGGGSYTVYGAPWLVGSGIGLDLFPGVQVSTPGTETASGPVYLNAGVKIGLGALAYGSNLTAGGYGTYRSTHLWVEFIEP